MMSSSVIVAIVVVAASVLPLSFTLFNLVFWRRGRPDGQIPGSVSILIPARNEAENIGESLSAARNSRHPILEILVYDDMSTDDTAAVVQRHADVDARVRLINGGDLPRGWAGKSHACHRLAESARGDVLLFLDADVRLEADGLARIGSLYRDLEVDLVTAVPRQETKSWGERMILPLLHLTYTSWFPLPLVHASRDPRFLAANGQILSVRRKVYAAVGGFQAVKDNVVEDMSFCRLVKSSGFRVTFSDGHRIARCRMYRSARQVWEGFSKNMYCGLGASLVALLIVFALYSTCFVLPYVVAIGAGTGAWLGWPAPPLLSTAGLIGVGANLILRALLAWRFRQSWVGVLEHPLSVLALIAIGVNSYRWHQRGAIRWRGRVYGGQSGLTTTAPPAR